MGIAWSATQTAVQVVANTVQEGVTATGEGLALLATNTEAVIKEAEPKAEAMLDATAAIVNPIVAPVVATSIITTEIAADVTNVSTAAAVTAPVVATDVTLAATETTLAIPSTIVSAVPIVHPHKVSVTICYQLQTGEEEKATVFVTLPQMADPVIYAASDSDSFKRHNLAHHIKKINYVIIRLHNPGTTHYHNSPEFVRKAYQGVFDALGGSFSGVLDKTTHVILIGFGPATNAVSSNVISMFSSKGLDVEKVIYQYGIETTDIAHYSVVSSGIWVCSVGDPICNLVGLPLMIVWYE